MNSGVVILIFIVGVLASLFLYFKLESYVHKSRIKRLRTFCVEISAVIAKKWYDSYGRTEPAPVLCLGSFSEYLLAPASVLISDDVYVIFTNACSDMGLDTADPSVPNVNYLLSLVTAELRILYEAKLSGGE